MTNSIFVDLLILIPLAAAVIALAARRAEGVPKVAALVAVIAQIGLLVALAPLGIYQGARVAGVLGTGRVPLWSLAMDGLSTPLVVLTPLIALAAIAASWHLKERPATHFALLMLLQGAVTAVFLAADGILFYVAWEAVLVPMFFLIGGWGHERRRHAASKFFIYTFAGSALMLVGLLMTAVQTQSFDVATMVARASVLTRPDIVFWLLLAGFLVKIPVVPLHTWLPDAHVEAPTAGSIVLAGVLLKMGGYGILRFAWPLCPQPFEQARMILMALGLIGVIWGAAMALVQTDLKRLIAYSSVSHMGFVVLAIATATVDSLGAAMVAMVSHGFVAGMQFYLVGAVYERTHTRELARLGGLGRVAPVWSVAFMFGAMASLGLPGLSGFPGEFVTILESYRVFGWWAAVAAVGVVFAAAYGLRAVRESVQGVPVEFHEVRDLDGVERLTSFGLALSIAAVGLAPWVIVAVSTPALRSLVSLVSTGGGR